MLGESIRNHAVSTFVMRSPESPSIPLAAYAASGLPTSVFDAELGGMQLPFVVHAACSTWFQAACVGAISPGP